MVEKALSLEEVATLLGVSERTVMREIQAGKIKAFKAGRALRFLPDAVEEYIAHQAVSPKDLEEDTDKRPVTRPDQEAA